MAAKKGQKSKGSSKSSTQQRSTASKATAAQKQPTQKIPPRSMFKRVMPYIMIVFALILTICFITVHMLGMDDGAGIVGYWVQALFCALFGGSAFALPLILGYVGVKWCMHNIKWNGKERSPSNEDYVKSRRRLILQTVMCTLTLIMISAFIGVIADQSDFDILSFCEEGIELSGGGAIGGSLGCLFILCFNTLISIIIISLLTILFIMLALGLTPDYIITKIRDSREANADARVRAKDDDDEDEDDGYEEDTGTQMRSSKRAHAAAATAAATSSRTKPQPMEEVFFDEEPPRPTPLNEKTAAAVNTPDIPIGPAEGMARPSRGGSAKATSTPLDFGGDPTFDNTFDKNEFNTIDEIVEGLGTPIGPASTPDPVPPKAEPKPEPAPIDLLEMENNELLEDMAAVAPDETGDDDQPEVITPYIFPPVDLLNENKDKVETDYTEELQNNAKILVETLRSFRVGIKEVTYSRGPTITRYELKPEVGTRVRSIANLVDDIALNLATSGVRIEAPIPNKAAVGIEVPNQTRATVYLRDLIESTKFTEAKSRLTASLGMDVGGNPIYFDVAKMPHLLIAGTTGSGKSICINCIIISILYKANPHDVKLILIDPKKVEFNMYKNIPHLYCPIVSEPKKAAGALASAVAEMERRFELIESVGVRDIASYNAAIEGDPEKEFMPQMVIIIDELADLMMTARDEVETSICRLAQKARAAGIHVILGTQRPSVDVITGLIKANVPSRIACTVTSQVDSRTIIDVSGAENLIGKGDMLFAPVGSSKPMRVQGAFVSDGEVERIVNYISENNGKAKYNTDFINRIEEEAAKCGNKKGSASNVSENDAPAVEGGDSKFREAVKLAIETGKISTSLMQRRLGVGYGRAAKIIDTMYEMGYVSAPDGNKPRQVLITMDEYMRRITEGEFEDVDV